MGEDEKGAPRNGQEVKDYYGDYATLRVPEHEKRTFLNQLMVFLGVLAVWAAVFGGASMANYLDARGILIASILGSIALGVIAFLTGLIGSYNGVSTYVILRHSMGRFGSIAAGIVISGISAALWFAFETWLFGVILNGVFPESFLARVEVAAAWGGILMMTTALIGYRGLAALSYLIVPAWFLIIPLALAASISLKGGWDRLFAATPPEPAGLAAGITFVIGLYIVGATIAPDITRFSRRPIDGPLAWFVHVVFFMPIILIAGGWLQLLAPGSNLAAEMTAMGMGLAVLVTGILGQWSTNDNNLYSASLAWVNAVPKVKRWVWVAVLGVAGTIVAVAIALGYGISLEALFAFGTLLGTFIPPIAGVMIADYYIVQPLLLGRRDPRTRYSFGPGTVYGAIRWPGILGWAVGSALAYWLPQQYAQIPGAVVGLFTGLILHTLLMALSVKARIPYDVGKWVETETGW
ncbi:MAG: cytosine permease [Desulfurococcales archaeon]|nr:cytosine permease [Desulfurococcales archaeon]